MEIEAKFAILSEETYTALSETTRLAGFLVTDAFMQHIVDVYMDTPDRRLIAAGYACRMRNLRGRSQITLKSMGTLAAREPAAIHHREEWEVTLDESAGPDPQRWPASAARDLVQSLGAGQKLVKLFDLKQERQARILRTREGNPMAELALDRVIVDADCKAHHFIELEVELLDPSHEAELQHIVDELTAMTGLAPRTTSKFERVLALVEGRVEARSLSRLEGSSELDPIGALTREVLMPLFLKMQSHEAGTYAGEDPEELHDMRVATRRMRTVFSVTERYLDTKSLWPLCKALRRTAAVLGAVRDMDVFRQKTEIYLINQGTPRSELAALMQVWNVEYTRRRNEMLSYLDSREYAQFKEIFRTCLRSDLPEGAIQVKSRDAMRHIVMQQLARLQREGDTVGRPDMSLKAYHQLRIYIKHLRYTLEFVRPMLGPEATDAINVLKRLQDHFGELQDAVVAVEHLRAIILFGTWESPRQAAALWHHEAESSDTALPPTGGLIAYLAAREAEIEILLNSASKAWGRFEVARTPVLVTDALAVLQT